MLHLVENDQEAIDFLFENPADRNRRPIHEKILDFAMTGFSQPSVLSADEIRRVCYALVVHYAQMGIGHDPAAKRAAMR